MKFFSMDSKFYQAMSAFADIILLNLCWIIGSLPLVTVGASNAAMYTILGRRQRKEDGGTFAPFFKAWWGNLKMGTLFWVAQAFVTFSLSLILVMTLPLVLKIVAGILLVLVTMVFSLIYPQLARYRNRWFAYLRNAVILLVLKLGWVLLNVLVFLIPLALFLIAPVESLQLGVVWLLFGISLLFLGSSDIMQKILQPLEEMSSRR